VAVAVAAQEEAMQEGEDIVQERVAGAKVDDDAAYVLARFRPGPRTSSHSGLPLHSRMEGPKWAAR